MAQYAGETARTPYTKGSRHLALYTGSDFKMDITSHHRDPLSRVLKEAIDIQNLENGEAGVEISRRK